MMKRIFSAVLVCLMLCALVPWSGLQASAAVQGDYAPYAMIEYGYSSTVKCGTIRYVSQVVSDSYFYSAYWPSSTFGYYTGASVECGTASISMALSYIGVNKTANDILVANNGATSFSTGWGGSTYLSYGASSLQTATDKYINGSGKYSPPVIHLPGYSSLGHYVVVIGRSGTTYQILDPWQRSVTSMTVSGSSATYYRNGYATYDTIDQVHQWYLASAVLDSSTSSSDDAIASHCLVKCKVAKTVNTQPCSVGSYGSTAIESYDIGDTYITTGIYQNDFGNYWYQVTSKSGQVGYIYGDNFDLVEVLTEDITLKDPAYPGAHVARSIFIVDGTIESSYNELTDVSLEVYSGFGTSGTKVMNLTDTVSGKSYPLHYSTLDSNSKFATLEAGNYTYVLTASYKNYNTTDATTLATNTGKVTLAEEYFVVIPSAADQSSCSHSYTVTNVEESSCTEGGYEIKACSKCGLITEGISQPKGHTFGPWSTVGGSCTTSGTRTRACTVCGYTESETVTGTGHDYTTVTVAPTCTTAGSTTYTCVNCGDSYSTTTPASGHSYDEGVIITLPGCTTTGVRKFTCTLCGYSYQKSIYATGHTYNNGVVTAPTCITAGYTTYTCIDCGVSYVADQVPTSGHTYTDKYIAPTCTSSGGTSHTCIHCGHNYMDNIVSAAGHKYKSVVTAPTCTQAGYTTYTCTVCGDKYTGNHVSALGHKYSSTVVRPTCTVSGYTQYKCATCGDSYQTSITAPTGHSYSAGKCTACGAADPNYVELPTLTLKNPTLAFEDEILYNVYYNVDNISNVAEMGLLTFETRDVNGTAETALRIVPGYVANADGTYTVHSEGIPAKMLGDTVYFKVYAMLTDGRYVYSDIAGYHAVAYAKTVLGSSATTLAAKQLMLAMLNYGAAAQVNFNYKTDNLMNAFLSEAARNKIAPYDESMVDAVVTPSDAKAGHFVMNKTAFTNFYPSVSFEGSFSINYYLETGLTPDSSVTFCYWDADAYAAADKLSTANVTGMLPMTFDGIRWHAAVEGIAAKDMDKTIYVAAIYRSGGTVYTTKVIPYSLGRYCESIAANGNAFGAATAVYGYYAKAYFNT